MVFHGVGLPGYTGIESAMLERSRTVVSLLLSLMAATPAWLAVYKERPVFFKFFAGLMEAVYVLVEILAGLAFAVYGRSVLEGPTRLIFYGAPILAMFISAPWSASRAIILQYFAEGGTLDGEPLYGDITMKENNQDCGGKISGLVIGALLLQTGVGMHLDTPAAVQDAVTTGLGVFLVLSLVHVVPLYISIFVTIVEWETVFGVGQEGFTPLSAVAVELYKTCINAVFRLLAGLPAVRAYFNFRRRRWKLWSDLLGKLHGPLWLLAAARFGNHRTALFVLITLAEVIRAFASTAGARINGSIVPACIQPHSKQTVRLVDLSVANDNQNRIVELAAISLVLSLLHLLRHHEVEPRAHLGVIVGIYALLHGLVVLLQFQKFANLPPLPEADIDSDEHAPARQRQVEEELGTLDEPRLAAKVPALLAGLEDTDAGVRGAARKVASRLDATVQATLYAALVHDPTDAVRIHALEQLHAAELPGSGELPPPVLYAWSASFANGAGATLRALARAQSGLSRHAERHRQEDAAAGEELATASRSLELIAAALVTTLRGDEVRTLQRSEAGNGALALIVQQRCKLVTARPPVQQAMLAQWSGLQPTFGGVVESALAYSLLALPMLAALLVAPSMVPGFSLLATLPAWGRLLLLAALIPAATLLVHLARTRRGERAPGETGLLLIGVLCTLANPAFPLVVVCVAALLLVVAGALEPLARWLSAAAAARDDLAWLDDAPRGLPRALAPLFLPLVVVASPRGKFFLSTAGRICLAVTLCVLPPPEVAPWGLTEAAFVWATTALADELGELLQGYAYWKADRLNVVELPGLALASGGLLATLLTGEPADGVLAASVAFVLAAQGLRLLQLSSEYGPLVLMTIDMVERDLAQWLALSLIGVMLPFATAAYLLYQRELARVHAGVSVDECASLSLTLGSGVLPALWALFKTLIGGGETLVDCLEDESSHPIYGVAIMETYQVISVILLVNLLIALMGKTFDLVYENKDINYMYLFARLVISYDQAALLPPPLNLLQLAGATTLRAASIVGWCLRGAHAGFERLESTREQEFRPCEHAGWSKRYSIDEVDGSNARSRWRRLREWARQQQYQGAPDSSAELSLSLDEEHGASSIDPASSPPAEGCESRAGVRGDEGGLLAGAAPPQRMSLVEEVQAYLIEHEYSEVMEERWRNRFAMQLGSVDRKLEHALERALPTRARAEGGVERQQHAAAVEQKIEGIEGRLAALGAEQAAAAARLEAAFMAKLDATLLALGGVSRPDEGTPTAPVAVMAEASDEGGGSL